MDRSPARGSRRAPASVEVRTDSTGSPPVTNIASSVPTASRLPASFSADQAGAIDVEQRRLLDQAAYRFMKLQDSLGEKVLPGILELTLDPLPPEASFAEKLQRLERLGALRSAGIWRPCVRKTAWAPKPRAAAMAMARTVAPASVAQCG
mgnify:CR=1 FL=1